MKKRVSLLVLVVGIQSASVHPIDRRLVVAGSAAASVVSALAVSQVPSPPGRSTFMTMIGLACGYAAAHSFLVKFTPKGRYLRAFKTVSRHGDNPLLTDNALLSSYEKLRVYLSKIFVGYQWYLVEARMRLDGIRIELEGAARLLDEAAQESSSDYDFCSACEGLRLEALTLAHRAADLVEFITSRDDEYSTQYAWYQDDLQLRHVRLMHAEALWQPDAWVVEGPELPQRGVHARGRHNNKV